MGLYYDSAKGWQLTNEKTDYGTDYRTELSYEPNKERKIYRKGVVDGGILEMLERKKNQNSCRYRKE